MYPMQHCPGEAGQCIIAEVIGNPNEIINIDFNEGEYVGGQKCWALEACLHNLTPRSEEPLRLLPSKARQK